MRVQPRASRTELAGRLGDVLKIRVAAPPVDGAANEALIRFLAGCLHVSRSAVQIETGAGTRTKVVAVAGLGLEEALRRLDL